jgi:hypothetical protein
MNSELDSSNREISVQRKVGKPLQFSSTILDANKQNTTKTKMIQRLGRHNHGSVRTPAHHQALLLQAYKQSVIVQQRVIHQK